MLFLMMTLLLCLNAKKGTNCPVTIFYMLLLFCQVNLLFFFRSKSAIGTTISHQHNTKSFFAVVPCEFRAKSIQNWRVHNILYLFIFIIIMENK